MILSIRRRRHADRLGKGVRKETPRAEAETVTDFLNAQMSVFKHELCLFNPGVPSVFPD